MDKKSKPALKIILPIVLVAVIIGIWFIKTQSDVVDATENRAMQNADPQETQNPNFVLEAGEIDMEQLKSYGLPIIIDFGADSCIPCKEMAPVLKKLNEEWQGKVIVMFVDVWKNPEAASQFSVQVIPTQFFFDAQGKPYVPSESIDLPFDMYATKETQEHVYTAHQGGLTEEQIKGIFKEMGVE